MRGRFATAAWLFLAAAAAQAAPPPAGAASAAAGTSPAQYRACLQRFAPVGLPRHRSEDAAAEQFKPVICRDGYALSFNTRTRNPDWVMERLTPERLKGSASRANNFQSDPLLGPQSPASADYTGTGYDRGHQAPAADSRFDQRQMDESFFMSNMSPQVGIGFNRGQWKYLEEEVRAWVLCGGRSDVVVITGPIYGDGRRSIAERPILVPDAYYKIVFDMRSQRAVGFKLQNKKYPRTNLSAFVAPIQQIEDETGLDFFPALPERKQNQIEAPKGVVWGHTQSCAHPTD